MSFFATIFHALLYQPLFNALVFLYDYIPGKDFGVAIIILTLLYRILLWPVNARAIKTQKTFAELRPKIQEINEKFKNNKERLAAETFELYRKEKVNPFSQLFPVLLQIPILIALYSVFREGLHGGHLSLLYPFVTNPQHINPTFLGFIDLNQTAFLKPLFQGHIPFLLLQNITTISWGPFILALLAGISQFIQSKQMMTISSAAQGQGKADSTAALQNQMAYGLPVLTVIFATGFPAAIGLYWLTTGLFSVCQQWYFMKKAQNPKPKIQNV